MNSKFRILVICIGMAGLLWLINHLNREYTVGVVFNIRYEGLSFAAGQKPDTTIYAEVTGKGFALIKYYYNKPYIISLNQTDFKSIKRGDSVFLKVLPDNLREAMTESLPTGIRLAEVPNDTITFSVVSFPSREVPINVRLSVLSGSECMISGPVKIIPGFARITGPAEIINHIDSVSTMTIEAIGICDTLKKTVKLAPMVSEKVKCNISEVHILIPVSKAVEKTVKLHYNTTIAGVIYEGEVTVKLLMPEEISNADPGLGVATEVKENALVFKIVNPAGHKILSVSPEFIPLEQ